MGCNIILCLNWVKLKTIIRHAVLTSLAAALILKED